MAAFLEAIGFSSAKATTKPIETKDQPKTTSANASPPRSTPLPYFEKVAKDIVAASPIFGKARTPIVAKHRDKESLLCEIIDLKKALEDTELHLHQHKQHYLKLLEQSRILERDIEELELRGNLVAPRTGGVVRLESKHKGLGKQIDLLEEIIAQRKYGELAELRKGIGATHAREIEVERDTIGVEIGRLKIYLEHLQLLNQQAKEEVENLKFCKRQFLRLEVANPKVANLVEAKKLMIQKAREEIAQLKKQGEEATEIIKNCAKKNKVLKAQLDDFRPKARVVAVEMKKIIKKNNQLGYDRMVFNKEFREKHHGVSMT